MIKRNDIKLADFQKAFLSDLATVSVSRDSAMTIPAFANAVSLLSNTVAGLPAHIYTRTARGSRERATAHSLYRLIHYRPNNYMTAFDFWEYVAKELVFGNAYILIDRRKTGFKEVSALHPLTTAAVEKRWSAASENYEYVYTTPGGVTVFPHSRILHIKNTGNGITGDDLIEKFHDSIEQILIIEKFTSLFFKQGVTAGLFLETPEGAEPLDEKGEALLKKIFKRKSAGLENAHMPTVIPGGMKIKEVERVNLKESQLLELKTYQIQQVARMFSLPPHIIGDLSKSSFSNIQEQNRNILTYSINPYLKRIEQSINVFLLPPSEREDYYAEFSRDAMLEADPKSKSEQVKNLSGGASVMTINESRTLYNLPTVEGGDELLYPLNFGRITDLKKDEKTDGKTKQTDQE